MGMDVFGKAPTTERGKYFRNNVWWWRGVPRYIEHAHPDLYAKCKHWQSNDGDGLDDSDARELAKRLRADVDSGKVAAFAAQFTSEVDRDENPFYHFSVENIAEFAADDAATAPSYSAAQNGAHRGIRQQHTVRLPASATRDPHHLSRHLGPSARQVRGHGNHSRRCHGISRGREHHHATGCRASLHPDVAQA